MYDELKERCRACSQGCIYPSECSYFDKPPLRCMRQLLSEAADAIEELSAIREEQKAQIIATAADVNRAWEQGVLDGVSNACAIFLTVLADKFNGGDHIPDVWREINKLSEEIKESRISIADLKYTLREEYGVEVGP